LDVVYALKRQGRTLYGFGFWNIYETNRVYYVFYFFIFFPSS
jgi:hypothetical protein